MGWFSRPRLATAAAEDGVLVVQMPDGPPLRFGAGSLPWVMFLRIGEAFLANEAGWWLLPPPGGTGAVALDTGCPGLDAALRGPLRPLVEGGGDLILAELADPPAPLRSRAARGGVALLDGPAAALIRAAPHQRRVRSVNDLPTVI